MVVSKEWVGEGIRLMVFKGINLQQVLNKPQKSNVWYTECRQSYCKYVMCCTPKHK